MTVKDLQTMLDRAAREFGGDIEITHAVWNGAKGYYDLFDFSHIHETPDNSLYLLTCELPPKTAP